MTASATQLTAYSCFRLARIFHLSGQCAQDDNVHNAAHYQLLLKVKATLVHIFKPETAHCEITTAQLTLADSQDAASHPFLAVCREIKPDLPHEQKTASFAASTPQHYGQIKVIQLSFKCELLHSIG